ncbi:hypothetical protein AvCA_46310 [Azotobacter vinelandii CA]|uniref:DUF2267 domain-containing protein n=2 Tax=Azotobacter vinelandii TaxID=354 RepID=C1DI04_AZOVD|nr:DUF2267 domain-containing protein [Azotobacter vinelandii]ACO80737.1 conserved hypothetical protein [Azotobacter vinelandii DJ]AGK14300.1 hypothetical protein AvCA_46310 [Azotobacter vinelandii CA]AGK22115.1 hypothetical protein AvCA6_46310 [Azotobacter vinelandii CA6]WKN21541.1 DUF2267 domain-containing protein [Azotobacter vinelandii]SFX04706.1 Uncharacterized conserved protein, DUF2267 family [Azotobacter vinelandii]
MPRQVDVLSKSVQQTSIWLDEVTELLETDDKETAYQALRAVLMCVRDRIGVDNAAHLAAQLPVLIRGVFYDGFHPAAEPSRERTREAFLTKIHGSVTNLGVDSEKAARAVLEVMARHIDPHETEKVAGMFPAELRDLWPDRSRLH